MFPKPACENNGLLPNGTHEVEAFMKWKRARPWLAQLAYGCDRLGLVALPGWISIGKNRHALLPILCERGTDSSTLIIAFAGGAHRLDVPVHHFFETTRTLGCDRILLRDKYHMFYHHGVDRKRRDWPSLLAYLAREIARLNPARVISLGVSSGGYAALIAGHHLGVDFVHAFSPQTKIAVDRAGIREARSPIHRWRMSISKRVHREVLDLVPMLQRWNRKTRYFVHFGRGHSIDTRFAQRIAPLPAVTTLGYPCAAHAIATFLAKKKFLGRVLELDNQDRLAAMARDHFGGEVLITLPEPGRQFPPAALNEGISRSNQSTT